MKGLGRLDAQHAAAVDRLSERRHRARERVCHRQDRNRAVANLQRSEETIDDGGRAEGPGSVVDQHGSVARSPEGHSARESERSAPPVIRSPTSQAVESSSRQLLLPRR